MENQPRAQLATRALVGYASGPNAAIEATNIALEKAESARAIILVEGISDQIAVETLASRKGRDLEAERIMRAFGPLGDNLRLAGFYDSGAAATFRRSLGKAGVGKPANESDMAALGIYVRLNHAPRPLEWVLAHSDNAWPPGDPGLSTEKST